MTVFCECQFSAQFFWQMKDAVQDKVYCDVSFKTRKLLISLMRGLNVCHWLKDKSLR